MTTCFMTHSTRCEMAERRFMENMSRNLGRFSLACLSYLKIESGGRIYWRWIEWTRHTDADIVRSEIGRHFSNVLIAIGDPNGKLQAVLKLTKLSYLHLVFSLLPRAPCTNCKRLFLRNFPFASTKLFKRPWMCPRRECVLACVRSPIS